MGLAFVLGPDAPFLAGFPDGRVLAVTPGDEQIPDLQRRAALLQIPTQPYVEAGRLS